MAILRSYSTNYNDVMRSWVSNKILLSALNPGFAL